MPDLKQPELEWVMALSGKAPAIFAAADVQNKKDEMLADAFAALDNSVAEIKVGQDFAIEMKNTGLTGFLRSTFRAAPKTMKAISKKGTQDDEFDTGHDLGDSMGLTAEQATALTRAHEIIVSEVAKLREARNEVTGKALFTDVEIAKEIWEPLMRRKIIPENAISDQYSDVSRTFESASEQYDLRLAAFTESTSSTDGLAAKLGMGSDMIKSSGTAATSIMGLLTVAVPGMKDFPLKEATDICTAITATITAPLDITAAVLKEGGLTAKGVEKIATVLVGAASGWVTAAFDIKFSGTTDQDAINKQLGTAINAGLKIGLSGTIFAAKLAQGGDKAKEAFDELATIVEQCLVCAGSGGAYSNNVKDSGALALTGRHVKDAILGSKEIIVLLTAAESDDPLATITKALQNLTKVAIEEGARTYATQREAEIKAHDLAVMQQQDKDDPSHAQEHKQENTDKNTFNANFTTPQDGTNITRGVGAIGTEQLDVASMLKLAQTMSKEQMAEFFKSDPQIKGNAAAQKLMTAIAEKRDAEIKAAGEEMEDLVAKDDAAFRALLSGSETTDSDADVESIEVLILQIKKDQMIIKLAESLIKMPAAAVAAFLPPAAIAVDAIQLAISMRQAASHLMAWQEWEDNVTDAKSAMSVQVAAMANRAGISKGMAARKSIEALEAAIKLVGDVMGTVGGPFAPIGVGISKGMSAVSSIKDIILKIYDEVQLKRNWAKYQKALDNPGDRKAIRAAIKGNPTLAKYVIAYGGVIAEDPVAKNALKKCGLNAKVLQSPKTNEQNVVSFLEALYADDPVILERLDDPPKWHPEPIELTAVSIAAFSHAGQNKARPPLSAPIPPRIAKDVLDMTASRTDVETARKTWEDAAKATPHEPDVERDALKAFVGALDLHSVRCGAVIGSISVWAPEGPPGTAHEEGQEYRARLLRIANGLHRKALRDLAQYEDAGEDIAA